MSAYFDFAALKAQTRQTVHDFLAVDVIVFVDDDDKVGVPLSARWHDKINRFGNLDNMGWAERVEGIDRLLFNIPQLVAANLTLERNMEVFFVEYKKTFALEMMEPVDGPTTQVWIVKLVDNRS